MLYSVILCDQDCEARCESMTTTAQRLLHSEYPHITQCLTLACCGEICEVFTDKQGRSRLHSTQCVAGDLQVFGRCAGIAKTNVSNREIDSSTDPCPASAQGCLQCWVVVRVRVPKDYTPSLLFQPRACGKLSGTLSTWCGKETSIESLEDLKNSQVLLANGQSRVRCGQPVGHLFKSLF